MTRYANQLIKSIPTNFGNLSALTKLSLYRNPGLGNAAPDAAAPTFGIPSKLGNLANLTSGGWTRLG